MRASVKPSEAKLAEFKERVEGESDQRMAGDAEVMDWVGLAIENWARWHWQGMRWHRRRIRSLEGRWRSPQPWDAPPITPLGRVDTLAAQAVEDAWQGLSFVPKMVLKQWFVLRVSLRRICRSLRVKGFPVEERYWNLEIERAKLQLAKELSAKSTRAKKCR